MNIQSYNSHSHGFTLIEMIVSLALFSVVVTVAVGALLMIVGANDELQGEQSVMTSLSFALDSMSREIRTGTAYYCATATSDNGNNVFNDSRDLDMQLAIDEVQACPNGRASSGIGDDGNFHGLAFVEAGDSITGDQDNRILFYHDREEQMIFRRVGDGAREALLGEDIAVLDAEFFVTAPASLTGSGDTNQASVTMHIEARSATDTAVEPKSYFVQTTVTQRTLDI